jgi:PAS domain S-box-containing protein
MMVTSDARDNDRATIRSDTHGVIRHWGPDVEALLGHKAEQAIGQSVALIIPEPLHAWHWRGFDKAVGSGVLHKPGSTARVPALHQDGHFVAVKGEIGLTRDANGTVTGGEVANIRSDAAWMSAVWRPVVALIGLAGRAGLQPKSAAAIAGSSDQEERPGS